MKLFLKISLTGLIWVSFVLTAVSQPCVNGISTNPYNPVNNQFLPLANQWYPGNGTDSITRGSISGVGIGVMATPRSTETI